MDVQTYYNNLLSISYICIFNFNIMAETSQENIYCQDINTTDTKTKIQIVFTT